VTDAATLLWTDAAFGASAERAAARFATVRDALVTRDGLGAHRDQFLALADAVDESVWSEPRPYWWARAAEEALVTATLAGDGALAAILARFPADVVDATRSDSDAAAARCGTYRVRVTPEPFAVPDWPLAEPALEAGRAYHAAHAGLVEDTLATLADAVPTTFDAFARIIRVIGLKPRDAGGYDDFSNPELPGTFVASVRPDPVVLADHFVHELQHNKLSFVEELGSLFDDSQPAGRCYSPWRDDHRSPYGVFHGVYVFLGVHEYWSNVDAQELSGDRGAFARDQVARIPLQLALAVDVLEREAPLTRFGAAILAELTRAVEQVRAEAVLDADDVPAYVALEADGGFERQRSLEGHPRSVRDAVDQHLARHG
jgi:HEXXH motif-containing protein